MEELTPKTSIWSSTMVRFRTLLISSVTEGFENDLPNPAATTSLGSLKNEKKNSFNKSLKP